MSIIEVHRQTILEGGDMAQHFDMTRRSFLGAALAAASLTVTACAQQDSSAGSAADSASAAASSGADATSSGAASADALKGTYKRFVQGDDWGCGVSKVTLTLDSPVDAVDGSTFVVKETKDATDWTDPEFAVKPVTNELPVLDAYLVDDKGEEVNEASDQVAIEIAIDPNTASPFNFSIVTGRNVWTPYTMDIGLAEGAELTSGGTKVAALAIDPDFTATETSADEFKVDSFKASDGTTYQYAHFEPEGGSKTLVVWLHGGGEGGAEGIETDPSIVLLGNESAVLAKEDFQGAVGGANVLVPQCPTFWMDNGHLTGSPTDIVLGADDKSLYTASLKELIASYKKETGSEKTVLVGCSNGGYMTLLLGKEDPDLYDVYVPICGPLRSEFFTDQQIDAIKTKPLYFIWSKADTTVDPAVFELPLIERLKSAGATDLHVFNPDKVVDTTSRFTMPDSSDPYEYDGHWSWTYFFNDKADDDDGHSAWDFIGDRVK